MENNIKYVCDITYMPGLIPAIIRGIGFVIGQLARGNNLLTLKCSLSAGRQGRLCAHLICLE
jgi:hypothetical protein